MTLRVKLAIQQQIMSTGRVGISRFAITLRKEKRGRRPTKRLVTPHSNHAFPVPRDNSHLSTRVYKVRRNDTLIVGIPGDGDELEWILLECPLRFDSTTET